MCTHMHTLHEHDSFRTRTRQVYLQPQGDDLKPGVAQTRLAHLKEGLAAVFPREWFVIGLPSDP